jgi:Phage tail protein
MSRWIDLYNGGYGVYESEVFDISSDFESYLTNIQYDYDSNDGVVSIEVRISYDDGNTWTNWININNSSYKPLFNDDEPLDNAKFQYRVILDNNSGGLPSVFKSFSIDLYGAFKIINTGDVVCKPEIWIKKVNGDGDVKLINETNGLSMEFKNLIEGETVYVDCENEDIVSDRPLTYRYNDHNNVFIELDVGENHLTGEGNFELTMRYEFKTLQG